MLSASDHNQSPALAREARLLSCYLLGIEPSPELAKRYVAAHAKLLGPEPPSEQALADYCLDHPWAIGPLDAACALLRPHALLRKKILLMAAILEASPDHADDFLPHAYPTWSLLPRLAWWGSCAAAKALLGLPLLAVVKRRGL